MIAGQVRHATDLGGKKLRDLGATVVRVRRVRTGPGVERVAVQDQMLNVFQQRSELGQPADATRVIAKMEVG